MLREVLRRSTSNKEHSSALSKSSHTRKELSTHSSPWAVAIFLQWTCETQKSLCASNWSSGMIYLANMILYQFTGDTWQREAAARRPGLESWLLCLLAVWSWTGCLTLLFPNSPFVNEANDWVPNITGSGLCLVKLFLAPLFYSQMDPCLDSKLYGCLTNYRTYLRRSFWRLRILKPIPDYNMWSVSISCYH